MFVTGENKRILSLVLILRNGLHEDQKKNEKYRDSEKESVKYVHESRNNFRGVTHKTVSYTHLDVYKRQVCVCV